MRAPSDRTRPHYGACLLDHLTVRLGRCAMFEQLRALTDEHWCALTAARLLRIGHSRQLT